MASGPGYDCSTSGQCPSIAELPDGEFEIIGTHRFLAQHPGHRPGQGEAVVTVPRDVMLAFLGDFAEKVLQLRIEAMTQSLLADPAMSESLDQLRRGETAPALTLDEEIPGEDNTW